MPAHIIGFKQPALLLHHVDGLGVVLHKKPVTYIPSVPVHRKLFALKRIVDNQGNQLFRELKGPVIIGAVGNICRKMIGVHIGPHQHIRACLAGGIGTVGRIGSGLVKEGVLIIGKGTVHLVGGNMQKPFALLKASVRKLPCGLCTVQHNRRPQNVCLHKHLRIADAPVHMTFRRKVHDSVNIIFCKNTANCFLVTDIRLYKAVIASVLHTL